MQIDWILVIAMVLIVEGMMPLLFPKTWQGYIKKLANEPVSTVRHVGLILFVIGIFMLLLR
ncbi:DUF2065 domain-containing protein [Psychrosphaera ytuae]|uniref:DUF2065 domain-containing protein n=1 Tax=Psychrosphaera ytuae TaxID=2820710 RepID=A0A975DAE6_9GAMM|nr:DUF2065 domain-containing protein [Psychrosphaera ytuae]QTH63203.1 DUF2065 domain-containing protein [Psychrosphaera ytuae]